MHNPHCRQHHRSRIDRTASGVRRCKAAGRDAGGTDLRVEHHSRLDPTIGSTLAHIRRCLATHSTRSTCSPTTGGASAATSVRSSRAAAGRSIGAARDRPRVRSARGLHPASTPPPIRNIRHAVASGAASDRRVDGVVDRTLRALDVVCVPGAALSLVIERRWSATGQSSVCVRRNR